MILGLHRGLARPPHQRLVRDMSRFINSSGFPFLFPPAPAPPAPRPANHVRQPTSNAPLATMATIAKGAGGKEPLPMDRSTRPAGTPAITPFAAANAALLVLVPLASSPNVPVRGAVANHPTRNGSAVPSTSPKNIPSPWFPRPMAAKARMASASPAASFALLSAGSSASPSTLATPWKASLLRCSTGMTLIPEGGAFASGPDPRGAGLGAASGSRRLNRPLVSVGAGSASAARMRAARRWER
mmetsp:Transcript_4188/g.15554  ORF Transcript_4188/g.15554 Transcript_4188/m.15554 type:complete len:243 (+) Transcript_4188:43-771(+)